MVEGKCAIWGTKALYEHNYGMLVRYYNSPRSGGEYLTNDLFLNALPVADREFKIKLTTWLVNQRMSGNLNPELYDFSKISKEIERKKLLTTSQRLDGFLSFCINERVRPGQAVAKSDDSDFALKCMAWSESLDATDHDQFVKNIAAAGYLDQNALSFKAFQRMEELERSNQESQRAFVAMWFDPALNDAYDKGIEPAIREAGYEPRIIRNKEHNNKIDDEIIAEIRRSKFVIADFTCGFSKDKSEAIARGGVYYEAGFAQGLNLPVIWTCREDIISHVHFDTRQYNHIVWSDPEDLQVKLLNRIRATIT